MNQLFHACAFSAILMTVGCTAWSSDSSLTVPFPIGKIGATVTAKFLVRERQTYAFSIRYEYKENDQVDRARVWNLAGGSIQESHGKWVEPGAPLKIQLNVSQQVDGGERLVTEKIVERPRLSSWGAANLDAELIAVTLAPGNYVVTAVSLDEAPSFIGARTSLFIGRAYRGK
ncbi:MAG: DUF5625 family protein [Candidatus Accumulibacter meliphilus]|jgi:hypothetical protein|uniref:DUF5625 family protein n=1 Tax=Candidatus Accumulibacter meliphilus TaxID=2211374 RepID=UPI002FC347E7